MDWGTVFEIGRNAVGDIFNVGKEFVKDKVTDEVLRKTSEKLRGDDSSSSGSASRSSVNLGGKYSLSVSEPSSPGTTQISPINSAAAYSARWSRIMTNARAQAKGTLARSPLTISSRINKPRARRIT